MYSTSASHRISQALQFLMDGLALRIRGIRRPASLPDLQLPNHAQLKLMDLLYPHGVKRIQVL